MIEINKYIFNPFQENTYLIWDSETLDAFVVDPGCSDQKEEMALKEFIQKNDLKMKYLINTHCHIDHIFGNKFIKDTFNVPFYAPELDIPLLTNMPEQAEMFGLNADPSPLPDHYITEDLELMVGSSKMSFLFTPGHTPGEFCIYFASEEICISGDVLFLEGIGRTDLYGGDYDTLISSISDKLFTLPDNTIIYPGHGDKTTIGHEKEHNPFLR